MEDTVSLQNEDILPQLSKGGYVKVKDQNGSILKLQIKPKHQSYLLNKKRQKHYIKLVNHQETKKKIRNLVL
jgi:hypothetical protein